MKRAWMRLVRAHASNINQEPFNRRAGLGDWRLRNCPTEMLQGVNLLFSRSRSSLH